jgi:hypothetical protein
MLFASASATIRWPWIRPPAGDGRLSTECLASARRLVRDCFDTNPITTAGANRDARGLYGGNPYRSQSRRQGRAPRWLVRAMRAERALTRSGSPRSLEVGLCDDAAPIPDTSIRRRRRAVVDRNLRRERAVARGAGRRLDLVPRSVAQVKQGRPPRRVALVFRVAASRVALLGIRLAKWAPVASAAVLTLLVPCE